MGFTEESFFKSTYKKIYALLQARIDYMKRSNGAPVDSDSERKALQALDNFLG